MSGGETGRTDGICWARTAGDEGEVVITFPHLRMKNAGAAFDAVIAACRTRNLQQVSCWSETTKHPAYLGACLAARGFEWGWKPHWMALDLHTAGSEFSAAGDVQIRLDEGDAASENTNDLPYYALSEAERLQKLARANPRRTWRFGAWQNGILVGHCVLFVTVGAFGVAGIYNVGVVPSARNQGIGRALTQAACRFAQSLGCCYATLNAAVSLYDKLGFVSLGYGQTWWMHKPTLDAPPPTPEQIAFAEAIARGDLSALNRPGFARPADLDAPLPNRLTPFALASAARKPASARWLVQHGARMDLLGAWDLGWKKRVAQTLINWPEAARKRDAGKTLLHEAVERGDNEFVRLLLAASPDLTAKDTTFAATPLDWANHLGREEIALLIKAQMG